MTMTVPSPMDREAWWATVQRVAKSHDCVTKHVPSSLQTRQQNLKIWLLIQFNLFKFLIFWTYLVKHTQTI